MPVVAEISHGSRHSFHVEVDRFIAGIRNQHTAFSRCLNDSVGWRRSRHSSGRVPATCEIGNAEGSTLLTQGIERDHQHRIAAAMTHVGLFIGERNLVRLFLEFPLLHDAVRRCVDYVHMIVARVESKSESPAWSELYLSQSRGGFHESEYAVLFGINGNDGSVALVGNISGLREIRESDPDWFCAGRNVLYAGHLSNVDHGYSAIVRVRDENEGAVGAEREVMVTVASGNARNRFHV